MEKASKFLFKGAFVLAIGAFLSKLIGAIYRIPLTNLLGSDGIGIYQMVFPVYVLLLDLSSGGVPSAISKMVAGKNGEAKTVLIESLKLFSLIGLIGMLLMLTLSRLLSLAQGNGSATFAYITLSPSVLLVCLISCFRGYFQGNKNMTKTAVSQVIEQIIKLVLGILLIKRFVFNTALSVALATLAVTVSELLALIYLFISYKKTEEGSIKNTSKKGLKKEIFKLSVPITLTVIALPLSHLIDSFLVVNILSKYTINATSFYGLYSGSAVTIIHLPTSLLYGLSQSVIPLISESKSNCENDDRGMVAIKLTLILSIILSIIIFAFSPLAVKILFNRLSLEEKNITIKLIKIMSINVVFISLLQTLNGILIGRGEGLKTLTGTLTGVVIKTVLSIILLNNPKFNIYGVAVSSIACYFTACLINLLRIRNAKVKNAVKKDSYRKSNCIE